MTEGREVSINKKRSLPLEATASLVKDGLLLDMDTNGDLILALGVVPPYGVADRSTEDKVARTAGIVRFLNGADYGQVVTYRSGTAVLQKDAGFLAGKIGDAVVVSLTEAGHIDNAAAIVPADFANFMLCIGYLAEDTLAGAGEVPVDLAIVKGVNL